MNILHIESSIFDDNGVSTQLTRELLGQLKQQHSDAVVVERSFAKQPVPHLEAANIQALSTPADERSEEQANLVAYSDQLISELQAADTIVLGLPMYNFSVPSTLKAWFDHVARAGVTFQYTENGPQGLLKDKKVIIVATRGGQYQGTPKDTQTPFVTIFFNFLGLTDIEFIYAEQLNMGDEPRAKAIADATQQINQLVSA